MQNSTLCVMFRKRKLIRKVIILILLYEIFIGAWGQTTKKFNRYKVIRRNCYNFVDISIVR